MKKYILILTIVFSFSCSAKRNIFQIDLLSGFSNIGIAYGINSHYFLSKTVIISSRYLANNSFNFPSVEGYSVNNESISDMSLLIGFSPDEKLIISTGLGYNWGTYLGESDDEEIEKKLNSVSFPVNLLFEIFSSSDFSINLNGFGSLNFKRSFVGISLAFSIKT